MSSSSAPAPSPRVPSEDIVSQKTDLCISNTIVKSGIGFSAGVVLSVLLFKRRAFPVWLGTGFGLGSGWTDCQRSFSPVSVPGVRVVPADASSAGAAPATTLERLSQRAGEALGSARKETEKKFAEVKGDVKEKAAEVKEKPLPGYDCLSCRLTGAATVSFLGAYALYEAHGLQAFTRGVPTSNKLRAFGLVTFATGCFAAATWRSGLLEETSVA